MRIMLKKIICCSVCVLSISSVVLAAEVYPSKIEYVENGGITEIHKIYELKADEDPSAIPRYSFEQNGYKYILKDIIEKEIPNFETKEYTEIITVESQTNKIEDILPLIPAQKDITTEDGFSGTMELDISTIDVQSKGTGTSSYTITATRTYPNLAGADLQYIPKTTVENGYTLQFSSVQWQTDNTENVDDYAIADRYTAVVTYSGTGTKSYSKGYTVTAEYKGTLSKTSVETTEYTAIFGGEKLEVEVINANDFKLQYGLIPLGGITAALIAVGLYKLKKKGARKNEDFDKKPDEEIEEESQYNYVGLSDSDDNADTSIRS